MSILDLGILSDVDLRKVWEHEEHDFTPWVSENLSLLSEKIGISLELEGSEVSVDKFSADIVARNSEDDSLVLIENQLEKTDHRHLGQIMTYLAGLDVSTVIWIAKDFEAAHLSAIEWLNENTTERFAFFAVKIRAVQIADSPIAPIFEVVSQPNEWERQLKSEIKANQSLTESGQLRKEFWEYHLSQYPEEKEHGQATGNYSHWYSFKRAPQLVISRYLAQDRVGVFIRGERKVTKSQVYDLLFPVASELEEWLDTSIDDESSTGCFHEIYDGLNYRDRTNWKSISRWIHKTTEKYRDALNELLSSLADEWNSYLDYNESQEWK